MRRRPSRYISPARLDRAVQPPFYQIILATTEAAMMEDGQILVLPNTHNIPDDVDNLGLGKGEGAIAHGDLEKPRDAPRIVLERERSKGPVRPTGHRIVVARRFIPRRSKCQGRHDQADHKTCCPTNDQESNPSLRPKISHGFLARPNP